MLGIPLDCPFSPEDSTTAISLWVANRHPISIVVDLLVVIIVELCTIAILPDHAAYVAEFGFAYAAGTVNFAW